MQTTWLCNACGFLEWHYIWLGSYLDACGSRTIWTGPGPAQLFWQSQNGLHDGLCGWYGSRCHVWDLLLFKVRVQIQQNKFGNFTVDVSVWIDWFVSLSPGSEWGAVNWWEEWARPWCKAGGRLERSCPLGWESAAENCLQLSLIELPKWEFYNRALRLWD